MKLILSTTVRPFQSISAAVAEKYLTIADNMISLAARIHQGEREWESDLREAAKKDAPKPAAPEKSEKELKLEKLHAAHALIDKMRAKLIALEKQHAEAKTQAEKTHLKNMIMGIKKRCNEINAPFAIGGKPLYKIEN